MKIHIIAKKVAKSVFAVKEEEGSTEHAIQLFVENAVLPSNVKEYTEDQLVRCINDFLESRNEVERNDCRANK